MLDRVQKFGGALFAPVLFFAFSGILLGLTAVLKNPGIVGELANPDGFFFKIVFLVEEGAWALFRQMPLIFVVALPMGLANKSHDRACVESLLVFLTFHYFLSGMLMLWGANFGVDFSAEVGGTSGLTMLAGIKTLETSILSAVVVACIVVWIHNRYFELRLPEYLGIFQGSVMVVMISFVVMLPLAFLTMWLWPSVQQGIYSTQEFMVNSGNLGIWFYTFLEKFLLPTGLHHFIYGPFQYGPAVVDGGIAKHWIENLPVFAQSAESVKSLFPGGGYALQGNGAVFGGIGTALALYSTAAKEHKKKVAGLLIPAAITAAMVGITEPLDFTFLFVAPLLWLVHSILTACMATLMYMFGVVGMLGGGLIDFFFVNWLPMFDNHAGMVITQIVIGLAFVGIYFVVFRFLILKFDFKTPGRGSDAEVRLYYKKDYKEQQNSQRTGEPVSETGLQAAAFVELLGGAENITNLSNCATRLRVSVTDEKAVAADEFFKEAGAHGVVRKGTSLQVIVGLNVPGVRDEAEKILKEYHSQNQMQAVTS